MSAKRLMASALLALTAFGVDAAYGAPARAAQVLRALRCCSSHCDHARSTSAAARCCGVADGGSEVAVSPHPKLPDGAPGLRLVTADVAGPLRPNAGPAWSLAAAPAANARGAPLFLFTHSLRI